MISLPNNFEGTLPAYQYAVRNHADILDADVHWTKDGPDRDTVGTVVILHMRLVDFLKYGNSVGKSFAVEIKVSPITDARQHRYGTRSRTHGSNCRLRVLDFQR